MAVAAAPARKAADKLSVIGGNLGSAASSGSSGGGGAFSDSATSDADELDFDKWQVCILPKRRIIILSKFQSSRSPDNSHQKFSSFSVFKCAVLGLFAGINGTAYSGGCLCSQPCNTSSPAVNQLLGSFL